MFSATPRTLRRFACALLIGLGAVAWAPAAFSAGLPAPEATASAYSLIDPPVLSGVRWNSPTGLLPPETSLGLTERHEIRLSTPMAAGYEAARATYRYTLMERPGWAWKVGLTSNLRESPDTFRAGAVTGTLGERTRWGIPALVHVGGEAQLTQRWRLAVDADGYMTLNTRLLDVGLRVNYLLSPSFSLYGGLRLSDSTGELEDSHSAGLANTANVGVRLRF